LIILFHYDWSGTAEGLKDLDEVWKKIAEKTEGGKFMGRYGPWNKKYHWTNMLKVKDMNTWSKMDKVFETEFKRDYKALTHLVLDIYEGPI
jgi:hypothetical protein